MKTIKDKVMVLTTFAILFVAILVGGTGVFTLRQVASQNSAQVLSLAALSEAERIDNRLIDLRNAVNILSDYAVDRLFSVEKLADDKEYRDSYTVQLANIFEDIANNTSGVLAYYVRYNPEIMPADEGLFYRKDTTEGEFYKEKNTNFADYTREDVEYVNWWYETVDNGKPTWLMPYKNANFDQILISYIVPLYEGGVFIGVAGMDIDFASMIEDVQAIKIYETGYGCLIDEKGNILYNPNYEIGTPLDKTGLHGDFSFEADNSGTTPFTYYMDGVEKQLAYETLINGMKLVVTAPSSEINAISNRHTRQVIVSTIIILISFGFIVIMFAGKITRPLKELAEVAKEINNGKLEVTFPEETTDEIGELTHALEKMVHHLKHHIDDLNSLAYHDSLTGVKNKTAYDDAAAKLDQIKGDKEYGIIVFDANNLKKINDTYGHERGNIYLQNACKLTCRIFKGSPVFRIGGDEFVVILQGDDYDNCYKLMRDFDLEAEKINNETVNEWEKINIAKGLVKYDPGTDTTVESVFKRADARMYVAKQKMKLAEL
ncbi:MAG: diguanylate cyclase [Butyrivibrio sp.]|nr:diguanylate cyclase [Butyrivibrio sp.]